MPPEDAAPVRLISAAARALTRRTRFGRLWTRVFGVVALYMLGALAMRLPFPWVRSALVAVALALSSIVLLGRQRGRAPLLAELDATYGRMVPSERPRFHRALALFERLSKPDHASEGSVELAEHHLQRLLDSVSAERILEFCEREGRRVRRRALLLFSFVAVLFVGIQLPLAEGTLLLFAREGKAPVGIGYAEEIHVVAQVPEYTRLKPSERPLYRDVERPPDGSEIRVRFVPRVSRDYVLSFAGREMPLVSDGRGAFVGRFVLTEPGKLRVAARFAAGLVEDLFEQELVPEPDAPPLVRLEEAPRTVRLAEVGAGLELAYGVVDDYGIAEVVLVLESGSKREQRRLAELDGTTRRYDGAYVVPAKTPFFKQAFVPVRVTIEARDANRAKGARAGRSESVTLVPPEVGEPEARFSETVYRFRDALAGTLGASLEESLSVSERRAPLTEAMRELRKGLEADPTAPPAARRFLEQAYEKTEKDPSSEALQNFLLGVDVFLQGHHRKTATEVAKSLGRVVREVASSVRRRREEATSPGDEESRLLLEASERGAKHLALLGALGRDLGGVARGDLARVRRSLDGKDLVGAERAALHLAQRLERASPSFGSKGGAPARGGGGVESGGGVGAPSEDAVSREPSAFEQSERAMEKLSRDQAKQLSDLEKMIEEAQAAASRRSSSAEELERLAEDVETSARDLPESSRSNASREAARARAAAEAMAGALRGGALDRAIERGEEAEKALETARRFLEEEGDFRLSESERRAASEAVRKALARARELEGALGEERRKEMAERGRDLEGAQRALRERAEQLEREASGSLSDEAREHLNDAAKSMRRAERALEEGRGDEARAAAEEAQRSLDKARGSDDPREAAPEEPPTKSDSSSLSGEVPGGSEDSSKEFRRRVRSGLGRPGGRLSGAVQKYAEELE